MSRTGHDLGQRLRALRYEAGLTQRQLSERSGVARSALAAIESGHRSPTMATLERLAKACGGTLADLVDVVSQQSSLEPVIAEWVRLERLRPVTRPTPEELEWLRAIPPGFWTGLPPTPEVLADLVELRRKRQPSD